MSPISMKEKKPKPTKKSASCVRAKAGVPAVVEIPPSPFGQWIGNEVIKINTTMRMHTGGGRIFTCGWCGKTFFGDRKKLELHQVGDHFEQLKEHTRLHFQSLNAKPTTYTS